MLKYLETKTVFRGLKIVFKTPFFLIVINDIRIF